MLRSEGRARVCSGGGSHSSAQGHQHPRLALRGMVTLSSLEALGLAVPSQIQLLRDPACDFKRRVQTAQSQGLTHLQPGTCPRAPPGQEDSSRSQDCGG